ncbi:hypothetical protein M3J09_002202 [Ascochyta lentis]
MIIYNITRQVLIDKTASWSSGMILALGKITYSTARGPAFESRWGPVIFQVFVAI